MHTAKTDTGKKYDHNEDFYFLPQPDKRFDITESAIDQKGRLFLLCDGMGGRNAGEVASQMTSNWVAAAFYSEGKEAGTTADTLKQIISETNSRIYTLADEHEQYSGMCTTIAAAHIKDKKLTVCSLGDSRVYLLRNKKLEQLTEDHSEVWKMYKDGLISKEELRTHPRSHVLLLAIGAKAELEPNDIFSCEKELKKRDILLLCSDGLSDLVPEDEIEAVLNGKGTPEVKAKELVDMANRAGGRDNITVILVEN